MRKSPGRRRTPRWSSNQVAGLLAATRAVLESGRFPDAAGMILAKCRTTLVSEAALLAVPSASRADLEVALVAASRRLDLAVGAPVRLRRLIGRASKLDQGVFANKLSKGEQAGLAAMGLPFARNALVAPIRLGGDLAGVLLLANKPGGYSSLDSGLAAVFAGITAVAIRSRSREATAVAALLREPAESPETHLENLPDVVARFDTHRRLISVSATIGLLADRPADTLHGKTIVESGMPPETTQPWDAALQRVLATGRMESVELEFPGPILKRRLDCRLVPERGASGEIESIQSVARDVTALWLAFESAKRSRAVAEALRETTLLLNRRRDRAGVLVTLLECVRNLIPFDRGQALLLDDALRVSVRAIFDGNEVLPLAPDAPEDLDPGAHPIVQDILTRRTTVLIPDVRDRPDWSPEAGRSPDISWLGTPLFARGEVAGLLSLSRARAHAFNQEHARLAEALSAEASVAVENAVLFEQMQASGARMQALSRRLVEVQENERNRIARELHDEAGQALVSLRYGLRLLEREIQSGRQVTEQFADLVQRIDALIDGLHRLAADLRPAILSHLSLEAVLRQYTRSVAEQSGLTVRFKARGLLGRRLSSALETPIYRVVQEAMTNVVRHARATRVDVLVELSDERVIVMVEDDGVGFDPARLMTEGTHFGLLGMKERAAALGGTLTVESKPGAGTTIVVEVPVDDPDRDR